MKRIFIPQFLLGLIFIFCSCSCSKEKKDPGWEWPEKPPVSPGSLVEKPRYIWIDAAANFPDFANSKENISRDLKLAKDAGFTHIVVDVRPTNGDVLYKTSKIEQVKWLGAWMSSGYKKVERTETWDYLTAFIDIGHELGLKVYAGFNTFVGGNKTSLGNAGLLFRDDTKRAWATQLLTPDGIVSTLDDNSKTGSRFFNPGNSNVQEFILGLLDDLAAYENLDGIILDRGRFYDLNSDFSDDTRKAFEQYIGKTLSDFPQSIMTSEVKEGNLPQILPSDLKKWLEFRAKVIHDFMENAQRRVKTVNPNINFGVYVGGWYSTYYSVGVNWASPKYNTSLHFSEWATPNYMNFGYADLMDVILIGAYASPKRVYGTNEWSIQGFCRLATDKIGADALVVGGPDVGNGEWATEDANTINSAITSSVDAAINACDGFFLFDMIHLKKKNQWMYVKKGIADYLKTVEDKK